MLDPPADLVVPVARILDRLGIPYFVGGSLASAAYGFPRTTLDADLVIDPTREQVDGLREALQDDFYVSRDAMAQALKERDSFNAIHLSSGFKIDFFILGRGAFDRESFNRRRPIKLDEPEEVLFFYSPEDTVLRKLEWYRKGGEVSEHQWRDVIGILVVQHGRLDDAYMKRWAATLGVSDLLERVTSEAAAG
jgi:hypothetical protein